MLREHVKKPITKAELKQQVLRDRADKSGLFFKAVMAKANDILADLAGLELMLDKTAEDEDGAPRRSLQAGELMWL